MKMFVWINYCVNYTMITILFKNFKFGPSTFCFPKMSLNLQNLHIGSFLLSFHYYSNKKYKITILPSFHILLAFFLFFSFIFLPNLFPFISFPFFKFLFISFFPLFFFPTFFVFLFLIPNLCSFFLFHIFPSFFFPLLFFSTFFLFLFYLMKILYR